MSECNNSQINVIAKKIFNSEFYDLFDESSEDYAVQSSRFISRIEAWLETNIGQLNILTHAGYRVTNSGHICPEINPEEVAIFIQLYLREYYKREANNSLKNVTSSYSSSTIGESSFTMSDWVELREGDSSIKRQSLVSTPQQRIQAAQAYKSISQDADIKLREMVQYYNLHRALPRQVVAEYTGESKCECKLSECEVDLHSCPEIPTPTDTLTDTATDTESQTDTVTDTESQTDTLTDTVTDTESQTDTLTDTVTDTESQTDTLTDTVTDTESQTDTLTDTVTDTESQTDTQTDTLTDTLTDTVTDTVTDTESQTDTQTDTLTDTTTFTLVTDSCCGEVDNTFKINNQNNFTIVDGQTGAPISINNAHAAIVGADLCTGMVSSGGTTKNIKIITDGAVELLDISFPGDISEPEVFIKKIYNQVNVAASQKTPSNFTENKDPVTPTSTETNCGFGFCMEYAPCQDADAAVESCIDRGKCPNALALESVFVGFGDAETPPEVYVDNGRCYKKVARSSAVNCNFFAEIADCDSTKFKDSGGLLDSFTKRLTNAIVVHDNCNGCCQCNTDSTCYSCTTVWSGLEGTCDISQ